MYRRNSEFAQLNPNHVNSLDYLGDDRWMVRSNGQVLVFLSFLFSRFHSFLESNCLDDRRFAHLHCVQVEQYLFLSFSSHKFFFFRARCFRDKEEAEKFKANTDNLTLDGILGKLRQDMAEKGVLSSPDQPMVGFE